MWSVLFLQVDGHKLMQDFNLGEWRISPQQNRVSNKHDHRSLEHTPMQLLLFLAANPGSIISKGELLDHIWAGKVVGEEVLTVAISQIRKALDDKPRHPRFIKTIPGRGYQLIMTPHQQTTRARLPGLFRLLALAGSALGILLWLWIDHRPQPRYPNEALQAYQQGRYLLSQQREASVRAALTRFDQALALAPEMGEARWGKVQGQLALDNPPDIGLLITELQRAVEQSPDFAPAHLSLAQLLFTRRWDFAGAGRHFRQALELDGSDPLTHFLYSQFLLAQGRFEPAMTHVRRYVELSPEQYAAPVVAWIYAMTGHYQLAGLELDKIASVSEPDQAFHMSAQAIRKHLGDELSAFTHLYKVMDMQGYEPKVLQQASSEFQHQGLQGLFRWLLERQDRVNIGHYQPPLSWARYAIAAGDQQAALTWLQQAVQQRQTELLWMAVDPWYAPLHSLPEFQKLLREIGINS
ncbi:winged helix-turn-helix domain-containing protein [Bowmanella dokdonensis]|uniref:Winged helix-turn-helix domain-containing protein n=1 Tax=Bowmanella dokdonensis TaxID=751969 RepID=A0A939DL74_9ALTE|nr:winged helix-turn-helix domain-containing protein [Bowmanella dokdonensis]MBN7823841.1 winged helix-turn-helix domain-containing protein [Bowmanella dokdonensis]